MTDNQAYTASLEASIAKLVAALEMCAFQLEQIGAPHMLPYVPGALAIQCEVKAKVARRAISDQEGCGA